MSPAITTVTPSQTTGVGVGPPSSIPLAADDRNDAGEQTRPARPDPADGAVPKDERGSCDDHGKVDGGRRPHPRHPDRPAGSARRQRCRPGAGAARSGPAVRGTRAVGFEEPGPQGTREQLQRWDLCTAPVPVDDLDLDVDARATTGLDTVVITPAHQFPTGVVLAAPRPRAVFAWTRGARLIAEDDYDAEHRYDRAPVIALQAMAPEHVVYTGSVSKTLTPALRLGWLLGPIGLRDDLIEAKHWSDITSPALGQLVLAQLITSGALDRHLRLTRTRYRQRRNTVLEALAEYLPTARVHGVSAGVHLLVSLPELDDDAALAARALTHGVTVHPLSWHRQRQGPAGLVIGYAACPPDRLREAVRRLGASVADRRHTGADDARMEIAAAQMVPTIY